MPQFNSMGQNDVSGAISRAAGVTAAKGKNPYASSAATTSAAAKQKMLSENKSNPNKLAYWMQKTNGRKNAAYTLFKRQNQANRRGSM
jgi:hypothetical protein